MANGACEDVVDMVRERPSRRRGKRIEGAGAADQAMRKEERGLWVVFVKLRGHFCKKNVGSIFSDRRKYKMFYIFLIRMYLDVF